jgi:hypothetical protein
MDWPAGSALLSNGLAVPTGLVNNTGGQEKIGPKAQASTRIFSKIAALTLQGP